LALGRNSNEKFARKMSMKLTQEREWSNAKMDRILMTKIIVFAIILFLFPKPKKIIGQYYNNNKGKRCEIYIPK